MEMSKLERRYLRPELRFIVTGATPNMSGADAATVNGNTAVGYASTWGEQADIFGLWKEQVAPGAFKTNLAAAKAGETTIFAFYNHNSDYVLASTRSDSLTLTEDNHGLKFSFDTSRMTAEQYAALKAGDLQVSIGFFCRADTWQEMPDGSMLRTITDADIFELSPTAVPVFQETEIGLRSRDAWLETRAKHPADEDPEGDDAEGEDDQPDDDEEDDDEFSVDAAKVSMIKTLMARDLNKRIGK